MTVQQLLETTANKTAATLDGTVKAVLSADVDTVVANIITVIMIVFAIGAVLKFVGFLIEENSEAIRRERLRDIRDHGEIRKSRWWGGITFSKRP
jgi:type IV secretory pathway VirB3-like protein